MCLEFVARTLLPSDKEWLVQLIYRTVAILIAGALLTVCLKRNIESLKVIEHNHSGLTRCLLFH